MARYVRVVSISFQGVGPGPDRKERSLRAAVERIDEAAHEKPDIICLPETFAALGGDEQEWLGSAERVPGPTTEAIAAAARKHRTYIVCPMVQKKGSRLYNSSVLIDRAGEVVGDFHKMYPTVGEIDNGISPGKKAVVLQTDFGKVGFAICFDLNFREVGEGAKKNGAEILFFSSMYRGLAQLWAWAFDFRFHIVTAVSGELSRIVNPIGRVLNTSYIHWLTIAETLNLDCRQCHLDGNMDKMREAKRKYKDKIEYDLASPEGRFLMTSHHPKRSIDDIIEEFGFETMDAYDARARRVRAKAAKG
jgi:carbon-nitrogen hydrolase